MRSVMTMKRLRTKKKSYVLPAVIISALVWLSFLAISILSSAGPEELPPGGVIKLKSPEELQRLIPKEGIALIFFKLASCGACAILERHVMRYANEGEAVVIVATFEELAAVSAERTFELLSEYNVRTVPTLVLFVNGRRAGEKSGSSMEISTRG